MSRQTTSQAVTHPGVRAALAWSALGALAALLLAAVWVAPPLWALGATLRPEHGMAVFRWLPQDFTGEVFARGLEAGTVGRWMFGSALAALPVTLVTVALALGAAYAFAQLRFRGRGLVLAIALLACLLPCGALLLPLFRMNQSGLVGSHAGIVLPQVVAPLMIYVFKHSFDAIPADLREAAVMDGAGPLRILWSVYLPLSGDIVWPMSFVSFVAAWNNVLWPYLFVASSDMPTIAPGLRHAQPMAAALTGALAVALACALCRRRLTHGFLAARGRKA